jgi:hypothetical protein
MAPAPPAIPDGGADGPCLHGLECYLVFGSQSAKKSREINLGFFQLRRAMVLFSLVKPRPLGSTIGEGNYLILHSNFSLLATGVQAGSQFCFRDVLFSACQAE